ncbi:S41 family peptidase [Psychrobacter sp. P2G3]|uniref:S41 family peptidase n=1 Tax=Psychrobacter sp. P2G3 TaxID=1699622 RepID=UPI0009EE887A|nr:S41 family peptidase [Psychrobacter sp. P2G3]
MLLSASKLSVEPVKLGWTQRAIFKPVLKMGLLGLLGIGSINLHAQAANVEPTGKGATNGNSPTAGLQLISLNVDDDLIDSEASESGMLSVADETDSWTDDDIDALGDNAVADLADDNLTDIPAEVAQVSLNAISPETLKTFVAVVDLVRRQYVDPVNDEELFDNAMSGMLTKLDSHAEFLDAEAYENLRAFTEGDVGNVGLKAEYQPAEGYWVVTDIVDESPADKKGITVGDYIHQIGQFKIDGDRQSNDVEQLLNGIAGTQVDVTVSKAGRRKRVITLQRNNTHLQTIETRLVDGIAVIKLPAFQNNTRERILQSLTNLDAPVTGILLDLRDNPGGVLISAVKVASLFMSDTDVVQVKSRQSKLRTLSTQEAALLKPLPVVILQNRYSASAAEVLASSLQTQQRATIVGEVSYGKGSVQSVIPLNNEQAVKLTVAHYLTATGKKIDKIGVQPDVALSGNERTWEQQALDVLRQQVRSSGLRFVKKDNVDIVADNDKESI